MLAITPRTKKKSKKKKNKTKFAMMSKNLQIHQHFKKNKYSYNTLRYFSLA